MAEVKKIEGIDASIQSIDVRRAEVESTLQRVRYETEEVTVEPSIEEQTILASPEKYIDKVNVNPVTATIDSNIVSENIRKGIDILGVKGELTELKGQSKTVAPSTTLQTILPDEGYNGLTSIVVEPVTETIDEDLKADNIKTGLNILGVDGTFTSDANATENDILQDKTAYVNGDKIIGSYIPLDTSDATATADDIINPKTAYVKNGKVTGGLIPTYEYTDGSLTEIDNGALTITTKTHTVKDASYAFNIALIDTSSSKTSYGWTSSLTVGYFNQSVIQKSNYVIYPSNFGFTSSAKFFDAAIAKKLNDDGTIRMAFSINNGSNLATIAVGDYDLSTHSFVKTYVSSSTYASATNNSNGIEMEFHPSDNNVMLILDRTNKSIKSGLVSGNKLVLANLSTTTGQKSPIFSWNALGNSCIVNTGSVAACSNSDYISGVHVHVVTIDLENYTFSIASKGGIGGTCFIADDLILSINTSDSTYRISRLVGSTITTLASKSYSGVFTKVDKLNEWKMTVINGYVFYTNINGLDILTVDLSNYTLTKISNNTTYKVKNDYANDPRYACNNVFHVENELLTMITCDTFLYKVWSATITKILSSITSKNIILYKTSDDTAIASNLLKGKTAHSATGLITGTMTNNGTLSYTPKTTTQTIPKGYTEGGTIEAVTSSIDPNLIAENIKAGVTILGVTGTYTAT